MIEVWNKLINCDLNDKGCYLTFDDVKILIYYINKLELKESEK